MYSRYIVDTVSRKMIFLTKVLLIGETRRRLIIYRSQGNILSLRVSFYDDTSFERSLDCRP